jgi:pimeloyl-ACP methyl ester carboxylesterase
MKNTKITKIGAAIFLVFAVCYIASAILLSAYQERIVYQPDTQDFDSCELFAEAEKMQYEGTRMYVKKQSTSVVVFYHGNGGSACGRASVVRTMGETGLSYVAPEYAGYSNDPRRPSHKLIKQDVEHVVAYLENEGFEHVYILGESIGTGVAAYHVSLHQPDRVLLISPFDSLGGVAKQSFWFYPTSLLVDNAFDNEALLHGYSGPITIMHGGKDVAVRPELGRKLFESLETTDKRYALIPDAGHNDMYNHRQSNKEIMRFLSEK